MRTGRRLDSATYDDVGASNFVATPEQSMAVEGLPLRPSKAHLGTTSTVEARSWGRAVSIWPLGDDFHYAWYGREGGSFPRVAAAALWYALQTGGG